TESVPANSCDGFFVLGLVHLTRTDPRDLIGQLATASPTAKAPRTCSVGPQRWPRSVSMLHPSIESANPPVVLASATRTLPDQTTDSLKDSVAMSSQAREEERPSRVCAARSAYRSRSRAPS